MYLCICAPSCRQQTGNLPPAFLSLGGFADLQTCRPADITTTFYSVVLRSSIKQRNLHILSRTRPKMERVNLVCNTAASSMLHQAVYIPRLQVFFNLFLFGRRVTKRSFRSRPIKDARSQSSRLSISSFSLCEVQGHPTSDFDKLSKSKIRLIDEETDFCLEVGQTSSHTPYIV